MFKKYISIKKIGLSFMILGFFSFLFSDRVLLWFLGMLPHSLHEC